MLIGLRTISRSPLSLLGALGYASVHSYQGQRGDSKAGALAFSAQGILDLPGTGVGTAIEILGAAGPDRIGFRGAMFSLRFRWFAP